MTIISKQKKKYPMPIYADYHFYHFYHFKTKVKISNANLCPCIFLKNLPEDVLPWSRVRQGRRHSQSLAPNMETTAWAEASQDSDDRSNRREQARCRTGQGAEVESVRGDLRRDEHGQRESTPSSSSNYNNNNDNDNMRNPGGNYIMPMICEMNKYIPTKSLFFV